MEREWSHDCGNYTTILTFRVSFALLGVRRLAAGFDPASPRPAVPSMAAPLRLKLPFSFPARPIALRWYNRASNL